MNDNHFINKGAPREGGEIERELNAINATLMEMEHALTALREKIDPILSTQALEGCALKGAPDTAIHSSLGNRLRVTHTHLQALTNVVRYLPSQVAL